MLFYLFIILTIPRLVAAGGPMENHLDKSLAVRWRCHRWAIGVPPETRYLGFHWAYKDDFCRFYYIYTIGNMQNVLLTINTISQ